MDGRSGARVLRGEGGRDALRFQQRGVDAEGQGLQGVERVIDLIAKRAQHLSAARRVLPQRRLRQAELDGKRDQVLLRAVMDVALQPPALFVLRGDDPLAGRTQRGGLLSDELQARLQVGGQPDVREHQRGLLRQTVN